MGLLSRDQILKAQDLQFEEVDCPEWGGKVRICGLTASARAAFLERTLKLKSEANPDAVDTTIEILLVSLSAVDAKGKPLFTPEDLVELGRKKADPISRCAAVAMRLAGLTPRAAEDTVKNSAPTTS